METSDQIIKGQIVDPDKLQRAKEFRRKMTPSERKLWNRLKTNQLEGFHFRRQQVIGGFIIDFYCNPVKLIVEVDGGVHNLCKESDEERESILKSKGIRILRFTNEEIDNDIEMVLDCIRIYCQTEIPDIEDME